MTNYTKLSVNFIALIISIIIFCLINNFSMAGERINSNINNNSNQFANVENITQNKTNNSIKNEVKVESNKTTSNTNTTNTQVVSKSTTKNFEWQIEIPAISLKAEIAEGTTKEIMDKYVGHFEETSKNTGNIGLAAHNRGYEVNYFENLKKLKEGDKIIYKCKKFQKTYYVDEIKIIKDTDWSYLEETEENVITLITCVENEPEYRRCIRGVERK